MPKVVDHDQRRTRIIEATWRLIAVKGFDAANMRQIAHEAGFANGALARYFPSKSALMKALFEHIVARTNDRIDERIIEHPDDPAAGLTALRIFAVEVMPVDADKVLEAAVVIGFWQRALQDDAMCAIYQDNLADWRNRLARYFAEAAALGEVDLSLDHADEAEKLLIFLAGTQITGSLDGRYSSPAALSRLLDNYIAGVRSSALGD